MPLLCMMIFVMAIWSAGAEPLSGQSLGAILRWHLRLADWSVLELAAEAGRLSATTGLPALLARHMKTTTTGQAMEFDQHAIRLKTLSPDQRRQDSPALYCPCRRDRAQQGAQIYWVRLPALPLPAPAIRLPMTSRMCWGLMARPIRIQTCCAVRRMP